MNITYLGQAGLLFEIEGKRILIDPYLSDNVKNFEPKNYRRQPIDESFLKLRPDVIIVTHNHLDHLDKETLKYYFTEDAENSQGTVTTFFLTTVQRGTRIMQASGR